MDDDNHDAAALISWQLALYGVHDLTHYPFIAAFNASSMLLTNSLLLILTIPGQFGATGVWNFRSLLDQYQPPTDGAPPFALIFDSFSSIIGSTSLALVIIKGALMSTLVLGVLVVAGLLVANAGWKRYRGVGFLWRSWTELESKCWGVRSLRASNVLSFSELNLGQSHVPHDARRISIRAPRRLARGRVKL